MQHPDSNVPDNLIEILTGVPAQQAAAASEPMNVDSAGGVCDFCSTLFDGANRPVTHAFPAGEAEHRIQMGAIGPTLNFPIAAGLWYACESCRECVKSNAWAQLARNVGFPEGHAGLPGWQSFRVARLPGDGYAWPLIAHELPEVSDRVREAWDWGKSIFADPARSRLEQAQLLLEIDGHLYIRCGEPGDDRWLAERAGENLAAPFSARLETVVRVTLLPPL